MAHSSLCILRTSLTILSAALLLTTIAFWVRSYRHEDEISYMRLECFSISPGIRLVTADARVTLDVICADSLRGAELEFSSSALNADSERVVTMMMQIQRSRFPGRYFGPSLGFVYAHGHDSLTWLLGVPHWFLILLFAILPALKLRAIRRAREQTRGFEIITKAT